MLKMSSEREKWPQMHKGYSGVGWLWITPPQITSHNNIQLTSFEITKFAELSKPYVAILLSGHFNDSEFIEHLDNFQQSGHIPEVEHNSLIIML